MRVRTALAIGTLAAFAALRPAYPLADGVQFLSSVTWDGAADGIGGLSAIEVSNDGARALALIDRGTLLEMDLHRNGDILVGVDVTGKASLLAASARRDKTFDTEGLARGDSGMIFVSFEQDQRILQFDSDRDRVRTIPTPKAFSAFGENRGLEALAIDAQGHLFTLPESPRDPRRGFPVWRWDGANWQRVFHLRSNGGFLAVSATFDPQGHFYVLERRVTFFGFQTRLRRWTLVDDQPTAETTLLTTRAGQFGNLEGLSIWRDAQDRLRATMVSDNNFWPVMRTQIVEFILTE